MESSSPSLSHFRLAIRQRGSLLSGAGARTRLFHTLAARISAMRKQLLHSAPVGRASGTYAHNLAVIAGQLAGLASELMAYSCAVSRSSRRNTKRRKRSRTVRNGRSTDGSIKRSKIYTTPLRSLSAVALDSTLTTLARSMAAAPSGKFVWPKIRSRSST